MKSFFLMIYLCISFLPLALANMASPIREGSLRASPFLSTEAQIIQEEIYIKPDSNFQNAEIRATYHLMINADGEQVPLLFFAPDYEEDFSVYVDGKEIELEGLPTNILEFNKEEFIGFYEFFGTLENENAIQIDFEDQDRSRFYAEQRDLKFFHADLLAGEHTIEVYYKANAWADKSDWVDVRSFRYALAPAKYWKSFGELRVILDASDCPSGISTNLGEPATGHPDSLAEWHFSGLPGDFIHIQLNPSISNIASTLIKIGPKGIATALAIILVLIHLLLIIKSGSQNPNARISTPVIPGAILVPLFVLLCYLFTYPLIDHFIGQYASGYHGYTFLIMIFYLPISLVYLLVCLVVDYFNRKRWRASL